MGGQTDGQVDGWMRGEVRSAKGLEVTERGGEDSVHAGKKNVRML